MLKEIGWKILNILKADTQLGIPPENFYFGPPYTRKTPLCYVVWTGGPIQLETFHEEVWLHEWDIVVIDAAKEDNVAMESVLSKIERVREVLAGNPTLDGLVRDSLAVRMEGETMTVGTEWGKPIEIIAGARVTLKCQFVKNV